MEKICRVLYKHEGLGDWIAFEVYRCRQSFPNEHFEAYWSGPLDEVLFYESDRCLDVLRQKLGACVQKLGYNFFYQENQN